MIDGEGRTGGGEPSDAGGYRVRLDVYEGPFDLLLRMIAERKLDVSEVDLAELTADFLAHVRLDDPDHPKGLGAVDLETATHFLVVAATLIELKAARLLPDEVDGELEDLLADARDVLYARLLEYSAYRDVAEHLSQRWEANAGFVGREVALERCFQGISPEVELDVEPATVAGLAAAALAARPAPQVDTTHIRAELLSVREAADRVLARVPDAGQSASYRRLVAGLGHAERVVHFLALLELFKLGHVDLDQPDLRGDLRIRRLAGGASLEELDGDVEAAPDGDDATGAASDAETVAR